jgi:hypothetical protein
MKMKKAIASKHNSLMEYRITWRGSNSVEESTQHYNVFHSSEALDFLAHTLRSGHLHVKSLRVLAVEEYCRFGDIWIDRMAPAVQFATAEEIGGRILVTEEVSGGAKDG